MQKVQAFKCGSTHLHETALDAAKCEARSALIAIAGRDVQYSGGTPMCDLGRLSAHAREIIKALEPVADLLPPPKKKPADA